ncbi:hypothetical protein TMatcc_009418 [Talaromyces marneffei ATCC 18224]
MTYWMYFYTSTEEEKEETIWAGTAFVVVKYGQHDPHSVTYGINSSYPNDDDKEPITYYNAKHTEP